MITNSNNHKFDFKSNFMKKIEYLEIILDLYKSNPLDAIHNLNILYYDYNQYLLSQNKNNTIDYNKKSLKNIKKEKYVIPKIHKTISRKDINKLKINKKFIFILNLIILLIIIIFCSFIIYWIDYFSIKTKLFNILYKNNKLEDSCYRAFNIYILMIFNNYTIDEIVNYMELSNENEKTDSNIIFENFYQDLYLLFDLEKDQRNMDKVYQDFEDFAEFNCTNVFINYHYNIIDKVDDVMTNLDLKQRLVDICNLSNINNFKNLKTIFERHFQFIKNGMLSLTDFSYDGLNKNLDTTIIGRISFFSLLLQCVLLK